MTMSSSSIIMGNVKLLPLQAQTLAGALLQGLQTGVGATAAPGQGKFPQLLHPATFKPMMYDKLPTEDYKLLPGSLSELMQDRNFMQGDFIRLVPSVVRRAKGVLSGVKKRGQAQGDMMDKATEYALLPGILREAFAIELEMALSASLAGTLALRRLLQSPVALPDTEGAGLEYLTEDAIGFCLDVARGTSRSDCVVVPEFLGDARWGQLLDKDARRLFETELKLYRDDLRTSEELGSRAASKHARESDSRAPALGLKALKASNHGCLVARSFLPAKLQDAARTHLPAVAEALERLAALPCEINTECDECDGEAAAGAGAGSGPGGDGPSRSDEEEKPAGKPEVGAAGKSPAASDGRGRQSPRFLSLLHGACSLFAVRGPSLPATPAAGSAKSAAGAAAGAGAGASHGSAPASVPSHLRVLKLGTPPEYRGEALLGVGRCACLYAATGLRATVRLAGGVTSGSGASSESASGAVGPVRHLDLKPDSLLLYSPEIASVVVSVPSSEHDQVQGRASAPPAERAPSMAEDGKDPLVASGGIARDILHVGLSCTLFVKPSQERLASMMKSMMAGGS